MELSCENVPLEGSKISTLETTFPETSYPPITRTFPFESSVAVCHDLGVVNEPVRANVPVAGLKSSAPAVAKVPPITKTFPLGRRVDVWPALPLTMERDLGVYKIWVVVEPAVMDPPMRFQAKVHPVWGGTEAMQPICPLVTALDAVITG